MILDVLLTLFVLLEAADYGSTRVYLLPLQRVEKVAAERFEKKKLCPAFDILAWA